MVEAILPYLATKEDIRGLEVSIAKMETSFVKWVMIVLIISSMLSFGMSLTLLILRFTAN